MKLDKKEVVAGVPILRIRDMLKAIGSGACAKGSVAHGLKIAIPEAENVIAELLRRGWLEPWKRNEVDVVPDFYSVTNEGLRLTLANAMPRIGRAKAEKLLEGFLKRCDEVDHRDEFAYYVRQVRVFGSYLTAATDLGDIDLHVQMLQRPIAGRDIIEYSYQRADESGRVLNTMLRQLGYAEQEVWRHIKARSPYISVHSWSDPVAAAAEGKVVFTSSRGFP